MWFLGIHTQVYIVDLILHFTKHIRSIGQISILLQDSLYSQISNSEIVSLFEYSAILCILIYDIFSNFQPNLN